MSLSDYNKDVDAKILELTRKIEVELKLKEGGELMRTQLVDKNALAQCVASLHESQKRIDYLEAEMARLKSKKARQSTGDIVSETSHSAVSPPARSTRSGYGSTPHINSLSMHEGQQISSSGNTHSGGDAATSTGHVGVQKASSSNLLSLFRKTLSASAHLSSHSESTNTIQSTKTKSVSVAGSLNQSQNGGLAPLDPELLSLLNSGPPTVANGNEDNTEDRKVLSNLTLGKCGMPFSTAKVSYKLRDLTYMLETEQRVKAAATRMVALYSSTESEKRNKLEAARTLEESTARIEVLKKSLHRYQGLFAGEDSDEEASSDHTSATMTVERSENGATHTGTLYLRVVAARLPPSVKNALSLSKAEAIAAVVRVDGSTKARSRPIRLPKDKTGALTDIRFNKEFILDVDKAQDVEVLIVEQTKMGDIKTVAAIFWFRLADVIFELSRPTVNSSLSLETSFAAHGLHPLPVSMSSTTSEQRGQSPVRSSTGTKLAMTPSTSALPEAGSMGVTTLPSSTPETIDAWFELDPVGQMLLRISFHKQAKVKRQPSRLGRQGAVRKRKQIQTRMNGHKFTMQQSYTVLKCALCSEFIGIGSAYQCDECSFTCHKKCVSYVVTTCIGASSDEKNAEGNNKNDDAQLIAHNIPHRFLSSTNLSANWCCHCGHMIPLGKKIYRCSDCHSTAHRVCSQLVPNFCGMSMRMANLMIQEIKAANELRKRTIEFQKRQNENDGVKRQNNQAHVDIHQGTAEALRSQPYSAMTPQGPNLQSQPSTVDQQMYMQQQVSLSQSTYVDPAVVAKANQLASTPTLLSNPASELLATAGTDQASGKKLSTATPVKKVTLDDFLFLAVLGKGNFGKVMLAEEKNTKQLFAIKVLKKDFIIENDEVESIRSEKRIFLAANIARHPFLIGLHSCIQTETRVYFIMEYVSGGDLMLHIQREQFGERRAKFYACEVLLALEFFHRNNIVYRDLKLDNIMLSLDGHIKLADYGLCKENMGYGATTNTFCGTPEFMAPEILIDQSYGAAVDWWALGVLIYEMICGASPFKGEDEDEIFESILEDEVLYPTNMSRDAVSICQKLLTKIPSKRLGSGPQDSEEIKSHPFFRGVNWDDIYYKRIPPPFMPKITHAADVSNFDSEFTREMPVLTPVQTVMSEAEQAEFRDFSYVAEWTKPQ